MSDTTSSRSRVTITLGQTGQVVKRAGSALDSSFTDSHPAVGIKRSVRERLGNNVDSSTQFNNKRLRRDGRAVNALDDKDMHLSKDDLRYKIMRKSIQKQSLNIQQSGGDLRNILSRPAQSSTNSVATRDRMPELKDTSLRFTQPKDSRQQFTETRDGRPLMPPTRYSGQQIPEFRAEPVPEPRRQHPLETRDGGRGIPGAGQAKLLMPEPRPSTAIPRMESGTNSYSPWTLERSRQKSPDESLQTSRGLAAPKRDEMLQRRSAAVRNFNDVGTSTYMSEVAFEVSRPMSSSHLSKMAPPVGQMKTMTPVPSPLPPSGYSGSRAQKNSYVVNDQVTVDSFLHSLGLEKYAILFKAEEVDMYSLKRMADGDLKELGLPMGPRKKILLSLQPRLKPQA